MINLNFQKFFSFILILVSLISFGCQKKLDDVASASSAEVDFDCEEAGDFSSCNNQILPPPLEPDPTFGSDWINQLHPDPFYEYAGVIKESNDIAACQDYSLTVNNIKDDVNNTREWRQGEDLLKGLSDSIKFEPLLSGHSGFYQIQELDSTNALVKETIFKVTALDCFDVNMPRLPSNICSDSKAADYQEVDKSVFTNLDLGAAIDSVGLGEGSPIRYMKDCKTELLELNDLRIIPINTLENGLYSAFWESTDGRVMIKSFKVISQVNSAPN